MSGVAKKWVLAQKFDGEPKTSDFRLEEEQINFSLKPGEILVEALFLTVDPYMRGLIRKAVPGSQMFGEQVARVKASNNPDYKEGSLVVANIGWRTLTLIPNPEQDSTFGRLARPLPDFGDLSPSQAIGVLGMPGMTAYFGLLDRGQPKAGETVLVSGAAGAVGSIVGQIAKIKGCTVIGSAGSKDKVDWITSLGFDHVLNYKEPNWNELLKQYAPNGVDLYFDNVGGDFSYCVYENHMKFGGRIVVCGAISQYNDKELTQRSTVAFIIYKQLTILGVIVGAYKARWMEGINQMMQWIREGKVKYRETITEGFEKMPEAFISLFRGGNTGKAVVRA